MPHHTPLISTIVAALVLAFVLGAIANRFRVSPLVGYLLAGVAIGPFTPGYVADVGVARAAGLEVIQGTAADREVLDAANLGAARCLLVGIPDAFEGGQVVAKARAINPGLPIIARSHSEEETEHLKKHGASLVIMGENEIAMAMLDNLPSGPN